MKIKEIFEQFMVLVVAAFGFMVASVYCTYVRQEMSNQFLYLVTLYTMTTFFFFLAGVKLSQYIKSLTEPK